MPIELKIILNEAGQIGVSGPIENTLLCFGLLEMAKKAINDHAEQNKRLVQPISGVVLPKQ